MSSSNDLYKVLGVDRTASDAEIRSAFEKLIADNPEGTPMHDSIIQAYTILSDMDRRASYDVTGKVKLKRTRRTQHSDGILKARYSLNTLFLAGAAITTVLFILHMSGTIGTLPFYIACGTSLLIKIAEYILRLIS